jgi:acetylglutamate kinase
MQENMYYGANSSVFQKAEELRKHMTSAENIIWKHIHINPWKLKFRRQHPISNFIADFYCHPIKLVIEIDGDIHDVEEIKQYDQARDQSIKEFGLTIIRFKNEEVFNNANAVLAKIDETIRVLQSSPLEPVPQRREDGGNLTVIKIGGNIIDDETKLFSFLKNFASIKGKKILAHGGGKLATKLAEQLNIPQQLVDGRRITDAETLKIVTMVYAGYINKNIVAQLQANGENAIGICGADGNAILAHKRTSDSSIGKRGINYGFVGDIDEVNISLFHSLLEKNSCIVVAPITHDAKGQLLNTNADTIAQEIAKALSEHYSVQLIYSFEKAGVLLDANDEATVIKHIDPLSYKNLKESGAIFAGMIPKLDNAFAALNNGVEKVIIGKAEQLQELISGKSGTIISLNTHE